MNELAYAIADKLIQQPLPEKPFHSIEAQREAIAKLIDSVLADTSTATDRRTPEEAARPKMVHWSFPTAKHSHGPWKVVDDGLSKSVRDKEGLVIAGLPWERPIPGRSSPIEDVERAEANTVLIAASPLLLSALHGIDLAYDASMQHGHSIAYTLEKEIMRARATLAVAGLSVFDGTEPTRDLATTPTQPESMGDLAPELLAALKDLIGCAEPHRDRHEIKSARALVRRAEAATLTTTSATTPSHVADALFRTCDDLARISRQEDLPKHIQSQMIEAAEIGFESLDKIGYAHSAAPAAPKPTRVAPPLPESAPSKKTR